MVKFNLADHVRAPRYISIVPSNIEEATAIIREAMAELELPRTQWAAAVKATAGYRCEGPGPHAGRLEAHRQLAGDDTVLSGRCLCRKCFERESGLEPAELSDLNLLAGYVARGFTISDIARDLGCSTRRVRESFRRFGLPTPSELDYQWRDTQRLRGIV